MATTLIEEASFLDPDTGRWVSTLHCNHDTANASTPQEIPNSKFDSAMGNQVVRVLGYSIPANTSNATTIKLHNGEENADPLWKRVIPAGEYIEDLGGFIHTSVNKNLYITSDQAIGDFTIIVEMIRGKA